VDDINAPPTGGNEAPASGDQAGEPKDAAYWQREAERAFGRRAESVAERDAALAKLREYEDQGKSVKAAEAKRLAEAGEYKASYEQATEQLAQLLPIAQEYQALREHLDLQLVEQRKELPAEYRELIPESLPVQQQLAQLERVRKLVGKATNKPSVPPASPPPSSTGSVSDIADPAARRKALMQMDPKEREKLLHDAARNWKWGG
jgi:hypothetical protein